MSHQSKHHFKLFYFWINSLFLKIKYNSIGNRKILSKFVKNLSPFKNNQKYCVKGEKNEKNPLNFINCHWLNDKIKHFFADWVNK